MPYVHGAVGIDDLFLSTLSKTSYSRHCHVWFSSALRPGYEREEQLIYIYIYCQLSVSKSCMLVQQARLSILIFDMTT